MALIKSIKRILRGCVNLMVYENWNVFFFKKVPESDNSDKSEPSTSSSSAYAACAADRVVKVSSKTKKRQYNDSSIAIITEYFINLKSQHNQHEQVMKKDAKESTWSEPSCGRDQRLRSPDNCWDRHTAVNCQAHKHWKKLQRFSCQTVWLEGKSMTCLQILKN